MDYFGIVVIVSMHVGNEMDEEGIGFNKWLQKEIKLITNPTHDLKKDMDKTHIQCLPEWITLALWWLFFRLDAHWIEWQIHTQWRRCIELDLKIKYQLKSDAFLNDLV